MIVMGGDFLVRGVQEERGMSDVEEIRRILREFMDAVCSKDVEKTLSFYADDAIEIWSGRTFKGKEELRRWKTSFVQSFREMKYEEMDIVVQGDKVAVEGTAEGILDDGRTVRFPLVLIGSVKDGKIQWLHNYYDRLLVAKQAAKGVIQTRIVNMIVERMEKMIR